MIYIKKFLLSVSFLSIASGVLYAEPMGEKLFIDKCATCHSMEMPKDKSQLIAPPAIGLMYHLMEAKGSDTNIKAHIESFTMNPTKEKAICRSVRRFGVMPSQKENITSKELEIVAQWMVDNLKTKGHCKNKD